MKNVYLASLALALFTLTLPGKASAVVTLPAAYGIAGPLYVDAEDSPSKALNNVFGLNTSTTLNVSGTEYGSGGSAEASAVVSAATASVSAEATATEGTVSPGGIATSYGEAGDQLQYFFEVAAPTTTLVGMEIQARVGLSIAAVNAGSLVGTDQADLQISLAYADTGPPLLIHDEFFDFSTGGVINEDQIATIQTNTVYEVFMAASAAAGQVSVDDNPDGLQDYRITEAIVPGGTATEFAYVDPYFSIAPGTPDAGEYSFIFSPGVGNVQLPPIPEPSTWVMLLIGFAGLGSIRFRRARTGANTTIDCRKLLRENP